MKNKIITIAQKTVFIAAAVFATFYVVGSLSFLLTTSKQSYIDYMIGYGTVAFYGVAFISLVFGILYFMNKGFTYLWNKFFVK